MFKEKKMKNKVYLTIILLLFLSIFNISCINEQKKIQKVVESYVDAYIKGILFQ